MSIASVGVDIGKLTFHLVALDEYGQVVARKKFSRKQLLTYTANLPAALVGIEACSGAHFLGAALRDQGHDVHPIPAQFVKPFLKSNKNDFLDAEAIAEGVARKNMRFVPITTDDQLDPAIRPVNHLLSSPSDVTIPRNLLIASRIEFRKSLPDYPLQSAILKLETRENKQLALTGELFAFQRLFAFVILSAANDLYILLLRSSDGRIPRKSV